MTAYRLLFRCPRCGWWVGGSHCSDDEMTRKELDSVDFDLRCIAAECGWTGRLSGKHAIERPEHLFQTLKKKAHG